MHSLNRSFITTALFLTATAAPACDSIDHEPDLEASDDDLFADGEPVDDDDAEHDAAPPLDELAAASDPVAGYYDCPTSSSFCFWYQSKYGGYPLTLPKGDFAIHNFGAPIRSMLKRNGTYRVKVFNQPGYKGSCAVFGLADKYADSPNIAFDVWSARRMEPWEGGC